MAVSSKGQPMPLLTEAAPPPATKILPPTNYKNENRRWACVKHWTNQKYHSEKVQNPMIFLHAPGETSCPWFGWVYTLPWIKNWLNG